MPTKSGLKGKRRILAVSLFILATVILENVYSEPAKQELPENLRIKMQALQAESARWMRISRIIKDFEPLVNAGKFKEAEHLIDNALLIADNKTAEHEFGESSLEGTPLISAAMSLHKNSSSGLNGFTDAMDLLTENGMNLIGLAPSWKDLEPDPGKFAFQDHLINPLTLLVPLYPELKGVVMVLKMIDTGWRPMPKALESKPFDDPEVISRFESLIDAIANEPSSKRITHILLGNEIDCYLVRHPEEAGAFRTFYERGVNRIHQKMPWIKVGTIFTFAGVRGQPDIFDNFIKINQFSDFITYTYYPVSGLVRGNVSVGWQMRPISEVAEHLHFMAKHAGSKPFAFTEIGYSSSLINGSSEEKQAEFVREMFRVLAPYQKNGQIAFILYSFMHDSPPSFTEPYAKEQGIEASKEFHAFMDNIGIRSYETGVPRKAWDSFVQGVQSWVAGKQTSDTALEEKTPIIHPSLTNLKEKRLRLEKIAEKWHRVEKIMQDFEPLLKVSKFKEAEAVIDSSLALLDENEEGLPQVRLVTVGNGLIALTLRDMTGKLQIFTITPDGTNKKQLTFKGENGRPDWSPDGRRIAFSSIRNGKAWVGVMNSNGSNQELLAEGAAPDWSPDGKLIAFSYPVLQAVEIWVINADGSGKRQITRSGTVKVGPSWSPDGKEIAFILIKNPGSQTDPQPEIGIMNADGTDKRILTTEGRINVHIEPDGSTTFLETANDTNAPAWSPIDNRIAFWAGIETQYGQIWVMHSDGTESQQLTEDPNYRNSDDPSWSPDGKKILFSTGRSGRNELWVMDADGNNEKRLFDIDADPFPGRASWQPAPK